MNRVENRRRRLILLTIVLAGVAAFIPGILLPMMTVQKLVLVKNTFTVLSGLGLLLLAFSVLFPLGKFALMAAYLYYYPPIPAALARWQSWLGKLAKFSMIDVFFVAQMLMILKLGWLVEVQIHSGIYWFSAAVILSLVAGIAIEYDLKARLATSAP